MKVSQLETYPHILEVQKNINIVIKELIDRGHKHDHSKLISPEVEGFNSAPNLEHIGYNSEEYKKALEDLKPTLDHHYANNNHHPQHFPEVESQEIEDIKYLLNEVLQSNLRQEDKETISDILEVYRKVKSSSVNGMDLIQITEMLCDWKAATKRHNSGNILKSIEANKEKYKTGDLLANIFINTVERYFNE